MARGVFMESSKIDTFAHLPYRVPVDFIARGCQIFLLALGFFFFYLLFQDPRDTLPYEWVIAAVFLVYGVYLQIHPSGLTVDENGIQHLSKLFKSRSIEWGSIAKVTTGIRDFHHKGYLVKGTLGKVDTTIGPYLMIFDRKDGGPPFYLNIKPYSVKGLATLVYFITTKASLARIDESTQKLTLGIMPSAFTGEQKGYG
jgi:hypothetical protein